MNLLNSSTTPVMYTDPTGNFSLMETSIAQGIQATINDVIVPAFNAKKLMGWANLAVTAYDVAGQMRLILAGEANIFGLAAAIIRGIRVQLLLNCALTAVFGENGVFILKLVGIGQDTAGLSEAIKSGEPDQIAVACVRLAISVFTLKCQCFTGDTLVSTEDGDRRIDEIKSGDKVWSYNTETGEKEFKEVKDVSVTETDILVKITTTDDKEIKTTMFHPFYVTETEDEKSSGMWVAASNLVSGDELLMEDGQRVYVKEVRIEKLAENIKVYNLEVDGWHTYFVAGGVLVHNGCGNTYGSESGKYSDLDEGLNFSNKASQHMGESGRQVPVQTIQDAIRYGEEMPDSRGSNATMYYTTMHKNGKIYNLEVLYDATTNTVYHFEYARKAMGNLPAIK